jgi:nicotinate-nucleotide pyrophosphorylase (carboxylating)
MRRSETDDPRTLTNGSAENRRTFAPDASRTSLAAVVRRESYCTIAVPERSSRIWDLGAAALEAAGSAPAAITTTSSAPHRRTAEQYPETAASTLTPMQDVVKRALAEDVGKGDITSKAVVPPDAQARAGIEQKAPGVIAGLAVAEEVFRQVDKSVRWMALAGEGAWREGGPVAALDGPARSILEAERVALNFLGRLSGVATLTARYVEAIAGTKARILDTRKTTPGLRALEKDAVVKGGGFNHRFGLDDAILIKENHSALGGGVGAATRAALQKAPKGMMVVVECATLDEVDEALAAGADHLLADNMDLEALAETVDRARGQATVEASGGIDLNTIRPVAETGVDFISVGALTHSAPTLDLSLLLYT